MIIDGIRAHKSVTQKRIIAACNRFRMTLDNPGICLHCGIDVEGVEPDAREYECEACGETTVFGAEELLMAVI